MSRNDSYGTPFCHNDLPPEGEFLRRFPRLAIFEKAQPCGMAMRAHAHEIDKPNGIWWYCPRCDGPCSACYNYTHPNPESETPA